MLRRNSLRVIAPNSTARSFARTFRFARTSSAMKTNSRLSPIDQWACRNTTTRSHVVRHHRVNIPTTLAAFFGVAHFVGSSIVGFVVFPDAVVTMRSSNSPTVFVLKRCFHRPQPARAKAADVVLPLDHLPDALVVKRPALRRVRALLSTIRPRNQRAVFAHLATHRRAHNGTPVHCRAILRRSGLA